MLSWKVLSNQFLEVLAKMTNVRYLDLSYCDFTDTFIVQKIMEVLNKIDSLIEVYFIQHPNDEDSLNEADSYFEVISKMLKKNLSIQKFVLFEDTSIQKEKLPKIQQELKNNIKISNKFRHFSQINRRSDTVHSEISIDLIKLWLRFYVQIKFVEDLTNEQLESLEIHLLNPKHKIVILDISCEKFGQKEVNKIINVLDKPGVNNGKLDVIKFGQRKLHEKDLIVMGKWMLNKFSDRIEENTFDVRQYLFSCKQVETFSEDEELEMEQARQSELRDNVRMRRMQTVHFRIDEENNKIVEDEMARKSKTHISLDINRVLTADSYKIIYLLRRFCLENVDLNITNKKYIKESKEVNNRAWVYRIFDSVIRTKDDFFGYKYDKAHEK